ncbi:MAG TPA: response regulator [Gemmatimonadales bacterium]|nr:response regulator [Gemmatimonadales bacterium]
MQRARESQLASYAHAVRLAAILLTAGTVAFSLIDSGEPGHHRGLLLTRLAEGIIAFGVALAATPSRTLKQLHWFSFALALGIMGASAAVAIVDPDQAWPAVAVAMGTVLGAALFCPWSWKWQAALALATQAVMMVAISYVPSSELPGSDRSDRLAYLSIAFAGAASVLGAYFADQERRRIAASEARYRGVFEAAGDAIALLDADGTVREGNVRLAELLARPLADVVGHRLSEFYAGAHPAEHPITSEHAAALAGTTRAFDVRLARPDGSLREARVTAARIDALEGPLVQAILHDRTGEHAAEQHAAEERQLDSLARLAGGLAHQFNNLLAGILTHASTLREDAANAGTVQELGEIIAAARRGRELTAEMLGLTRHGAVALRAVPPAEVLSLVEGLVKPALPRGIEFATRAAADLPPITADPDQLAQACLELVHNAQDATHERDGARITLSASALTLDRRDPAWPGADAGDYVEFAVTDNGTGMDRATAERAFEPFFSTKPLHSAVGLGLAGVYTVVKEHRGAARIDSTPGRGTTVRFLVPTARRPAAPVAAPAAPERAGATILIVDDEEIVRRSLTRALERLGYRVLEAGDGAHALAAVQSADPPVDLVILDLVMPGGGAGAFELIKAVRPSVKVLVSSGYSPDGAASQGLAARVEGFLPKPYELTELRAAVERALGGESRGVA